MCCLPRSSDTKSSLDIVINHRYEDSNNLLCPDLILKVFSAMIQEPKKKSLDYNNTRDYEVIPINMNTSIHPPFKSYLSLVRELSHRYPTLSYLTSFIQKQRSNYSHDHHPVGCSVLEFHESGVKHIELNSYSTGTDIQCTKLAQYLSSQPASPTGRLYMLEDLSEPYIELLRSYLGVNALVFAAQIHGGHWVEDDRMGHPPKLLSFSDPEKSFTLRYYETRVFGRPSSNPAPFMVRTASNMSRNITFQNEVTKGDRNNMWHDGPVATIHRNASFWCRSEQDGSWNGTQSPSQCLSLKMTH